MVETNLLAFEGTPEGVKVYRLKEESRTQVDIVSTDNNNCQDRKNSLNSDKAPCVNHSKQNFQIKSDLKLPTCDNVESSKEDCDEEVSEEVSVKAKPGVIDNSSFRHILLQAGLLIIVVLYKSCQNFLCIIGEKLMSCLSDMKYAIIQWWNSGAPKPGKFSRRRKILK